jgi:hypothetical protein
MRTCCALCSRAARRRGCTRLSTGTRMLASGVPSSVTCRHRWAPRPARRRPTKPRAVPGNTRTALLPLTLRRAAGQHSAQQAARQPVHMTPAWILAPLHRRPMAQHAPGRTPVHCCLTMAMTPMRAAPARQPHSQQRSQTLRTARAATHAASCSATRMMQWPSRHGLRRAQGLRAQRNTGKTQKVGHCAKCLPAGTCARSREVMLQRTPCPQSASTSGSAHVRGSASGHSRRVPASTLRHAGW